MDKKAIVIGGSMAGKLAAKVLSDFFQEVVILEADQKYTEATPRKRTPQAFHPHIVLKKGQECMEALFPGFTKYLIANGSLATNFTRDLKWHHFGFWKQSMEGDIELAQQSRTLIEWHLQKKIEQISNIKAEYETSVEGLMINHERTQVTGVKIRSLKTGCQKEVSADLVVDTSGSGSKSVEWLDSIGVQIEEKKMNIDVFYATRKFKLKENTAPKDWRNLMISISYPGNVYSASIQTVENDEFFVTLNGYGKEKMPKTTQEFLAYAGNLPVSDILDFLNEAEPISDIKIHTVPYQVWRRFDLNPETPRGFILMGDAYCRLDPMFAQGISVAAAEALELQKCLNKKEHFKRNFPLTFHKKISKIVAVPWDLTVTEALRNPDIEGKRTPVVIFKQWYCKKIYQASAFEPELYMRLASVMNLVRRPSHLFHPKVFFLLFRRRNKTNNFRMELSEKQNV